MHSNQSTVEHVKDRDGHERVKNAARPPFRLSFRPSKSLGKSDILSAYPYNQLKPVTGKFYSRFDQNSDVSRDDVKVLTRKYMLYPHEKFAEPLLESHKYGWYSNVKFTKAAVAGTCYC